MSYLYSAILIIFGLVLLITVIGEGKDDVAKKIIEMEKAALDRWGKGDIWGYLEIYADEITYFDPETEQRLAGLPAMKKLYSAFEGKINIERYEMINPKVQVHGKTAVLTFNLIDYIRTPENSLKETSWNSTEVYSQIKGEWKIIHSHWSHPPQHK